ncbi:MAG: hypothetical protein HS126_40075 [Anaerolineales bacterium]|nr:hypothetical protein [Anaerolineales bacterium]
MTQPSKFGIYSLVEKLVTLHGHTDGVNSVVVTSDGRQAVSASDDSTIIVWDLDRREARHVCGVMQGQSVQSPYC